MKRERTSTRTASAQTSRSRRQAPPPAGKARGREAWLLAGIGLPILAVAVFAATLAGNSADDPAGVAPSAAASPDASDGQGDRLVYPDSPTLGPADAPVTLVEFLDPECEACRAAYPFVKDLVTEYEDQVRLVIRYIPGHGNSALAAAAIEEAGKQGRYWETLEYFFDRQPEWGEQEEPQTEAFLRYGADLGLDVERLEAALASPDLAKIERDAIDAQALGVRGTPTFFVNGVMVEDLSAQGLRDAIERALGR